MNSMRHPRQQRGTVIIIVLWTAVLLTVLVTAMAAKVRLSAKTVIHNQEASEQWASLMGTLSQAEAEILLENMAEPIDQEQERTEEGERREPRYRFNGQPLDLYYPKSDDIVVRIYDHAGKISLTRIRPDRMRDIIVKRLGGELEADPDEVQELLDAWTDWTDLNELVSPPSGAEREYYESLDPPYEPRNNPELDTVEEILLIRGFAELFEGVNLDAAFTLYGNNNINLNLATREALQLLPGMTDEIIENIIAYREIEDISNRQDAAEIIPFENLVEFSPWMGNQTSNFYSIFVYPKVDEEELALIEELNDEPFFNPDPVSQAFMEIVEIRSYNDVPRVLKIDPYGRLPDTSPPRVLEEDYLF